MDETSQQRTLFPLDTWSCSIRDRKLFLYKLTLSNMRFSPKIYLEYNQIELRISE